MSTRTNRVQYELMRLLTGHSKMSVWSVTKTIHLRCRRGCFHSAEFLERFSGGPHREAGAQLSLDTEYPQRRGAVVANNPERLGKSLSAEKGEGANLSISKRVMPRPRQNSSPANSSAS